MKWKNLEALDSINFEEGNYQDSVHFSLCKLPVVLQNVSVWHAFLPKCRTDVGGHLGSHALSSVAEELFPTSPRPVFTCLCRKQTCGFQSVWFPASGFPAAPDNCLLIWSSVLFLSVFGWQLLSFGCWRHVWSLFVTGCFSLRISWKKDRFLGIRNKAGIILKKRETCT